MGLLRRRHNKRIQVPLMDRLLWVALYRLWPRILDIMVIVKPRSVIRWHYAGFRAFWRRRSSQKGKFLKIGPEERDLIHQMKRDNPTWGCRRIAAELGKIGFDISYMSVHKLMPHSYTSPTPGWRVFLHNHMKETAAVDFLVVVTLSFQLLYAIVVISHGRRRIVHFGVTEHPTQEWAADQIDQAFQSYPKPKYLVRDRDAIYGKVFRERLKGMRIKEKVTQRQSPKQNIFVERMIQSIRHDCLDHVIIINERHLRRMLASYKDYYNYSRTHRSLNEDSPVHRPVERPSRGKRIVAIPQVGGLHHRYERRAA